MKICFVSREYPPETAHGGIGSQTYLKAHGLADRGHESIVLSASTDQRRHEYRDGAVRVIRIPAFYRELPLYAEAADWMAYSVAVAIELAAIQAQSRLDIIDFPEWSGEGYIHLLNRSEWNYVPAVVHLHGPVVMFAHTVDWPDIDSDLYRVGTEMERVSIRKADAVFSSSACSAQWCARHYGLDLAKTAVLHTGVDTRLFRPAETQSEKPTVAFAGRVTGDKGVPLLCRAAIRLGREIPGLQVEIYGRGEEALMAELSAEAERSGFDGLHFRGFVDRKELPAALARAHVFAGPSVHEPGPGLVYLEAMACGLPVVACKGAGAAEVVVGGVNGMLISPGSVDELTAALRRLLTDPIERERMSRAARHYAVEQADSGICVERIEAFYRSVLTRKKAAA